MQLALLYGASGFWTLFLWLLIFFTAFNLLEASLPSLVVKLSPADKKGTASGVYSSSQFFGAAAGGFIGGWFYEMYGVEGLFLFTAAMGFGWVLLAQSMTNPLPLSIASVHFSTDLSETEQQQLTEKLMTYDGVYEVVFVTADQRVYFKIDRKKIDEIGLVSYLENGLNEA
jgi:MFS family permease